MPSVRFGCGHLVEYQWLRPPDPRHISCPVCRRGQNEAMGAAASERVRKSRRLRDRRHQAAQAHDYGRRHDRSICPACQAGASFNERGT
jgi:hypothetical protein